MTARLAPLLVFLLTAPVSAQVLGPNTPGHATVKIGAERVTLAPGESTTVAVTFVIDPDWHIYWLNSGQTGEPTALSFKAPAGLTVGVAAWPGPTRHVQKGINSVDYVYEGEATILVPVTVAKTVTPGTTLKLSLATTWFACADICVDGAAKLDLTLTVAAKAPQATPVDATTKAWFAAAKKRLPQKLPADVKVRFEGTTLAIEAPKATRLVYFPFSPSTADPEKIFKQGVATGSALRVDYPAQVKKEAQVKGLLALTRGKTTTYHWLTVKPPKG